MREIKFRGKAKMTIEELDEIRINHDNGWVTGNLVMFGDVPYIVGDFIEIDEEYTVNEFWAKVHPESVGQFTGATNIYEGYICKIWDEEPYSNESISTDYNWELVVKVVYKYGAFWFEVVQEKGILIPMCAYLNSDMALMVIGNIYEDKHLLEVKS